MDFVFSEENFVFQEGCLEQLEESSVQKLTKSNELLSCPKGGKVSS